METKISVYGSEDASEIASKLIDDLNSDQFLYITRDASEIFEDTEIDFVCFEDEDSIIKTVDNLLAKKKDSIICIHSTQDSIMYQNNPRIVYIPYTTSGLIIIGSNDIISSRKIRIFFEESTCREYFSHICTTVIEAQLIQRYIKSVQTFKYIKKDFLLKNFHNEIDILKNKLDSLQIDSRLDKDSLDKIYQYLVGAKIV